MKERWRPIRGFKGLYEVSSIGRVRSMPRIVLVHQWYGLQEKPIGGILLKPSYNKGYAKISLHNKKHEGKQLYVHRLVAEAFIGPAPFKGALVCHKDDNPKNMHYKNLFWGSYHDNALDKVRKDRQQKGVGVNTAILNDAKVRKIRKLFNAGHTISEIAKFYGVYIQVISHVVKGKSWKHVI